MTHPRFSDISACVFDAYGTLFDVHSAAARYRDDLGDKADAVSQTWRDKQLQYTWLRSLMGSQHHIEFWQITSDALDFSLETHGIDDAALRDNLLACYLELDAYSEVKEVLTRLKEGGLKTAILSNGSPKMLAAGVNNAGIADLLDAVISVEDVGIFKPDPSVYGLAVEQLGVAPDRISFQSSNAWDANAAGAFGFRVAWCNRFGQRPERLPGPADAVIKTLSELPPLLGL
ncbi:MAG: haloacid dehalogenase type II [Alphaproteobacteria bacterium]|jgi:2-haloacid dehalogenase